MQIGFQPLQRPLPSYPTRFGHGAGTTCCTPKPTAGVAKPAQPSQNIVVWAVKRVGEWFYDLFSGFIGDISRYIGILNEAHKDPEPPTTPTKPTATAKKKAHACCGHDHDHDAPSPKPLAAPGEAITPASEKPKYKLRRLHKK